MRVKLVLRHLLALLLLPGIVVIVVPMWIRQAGVSGDSRWAGGTLSSWVARTAAVILVVAGLSLVSWCVSLFARIGQGTLAPWDPTRRLVAVGPYRHVRNPMITGVVLLLTAQALWSGSWKLAAWACAFVAINHFYFLLVEEPGLAARFGGAYLEYKAHVPRWLPRRAPWNG